MYILEFGFAFLPKEAVGKAWHGYTGRNADTHRRLEFTNVHMGKSCWPCALSLLCPMGRQSRLTLPSPSSEISAMISLWVCHLVKPSERRRLCNCLLQFYLVCVHVCTPYGGAQAVVLRTRLKSRSQEWSRQKATSPARPFHSSDYAQLVTFFQRKRLELCVWILLPKSRSPSI